MSSTRPCNSLYTVTEINEINTNNEIGGPVAISTILYFNLMKSGDINENSNYSNITNMNDSFYIGKCSYY